MTAPDQQDGEELEITPEQFEQLVKLGADESDLEGMSMADAEEMIDELRSLGRPPSAR